MPPRDGLIQGFDASLNLESEKETFKRENTLRECFSLYQNIGVMARV